MPHHIEIDAVHRVVKRKVVADTAHLQPGSVALQIAAVGIVGIALCHHTYRRMGAKIRQLKAAFCPAGLVFHDHDRGRIVDVFKVMGDFYPQHKVSFHFGIVVGRIAQGLRQNPLRALVDAAAEEIRPGRCQNLDPALRLLDRAFVQPFEFHNKSPSVLEFEGIIYSNSPKQKELWHQTKALFTQTPLFSR